MRFINKQVEFKTDKYTPSPLVCMADTKTFTEPETQIFDLAVALKLFESNPQSNQFIFWVKNDNSVTNLTNV